MYINLIHRPVVQVKDTVQCMDHDLSESNTKHIYVGIVYLCIRGWAMGTENSIIPI